LLRRLHVLVFICIGSRRIEYVACTSKPDGACMLQQARNPLMDLDDRGQRPGFLIHDRDPKFGRALDAIFDREGLKVIRTPVKAPNANAHIERWVGSVRRECLDRLLIFNRRQLEHVIRVYVRHYNGHRPVGFANSFAAFFDRLRGPGSVGALAVFEWEARACCGRLSILPSATCSRWCCCWLGRVVRRSWRFCVSDTSWRFCVGRPAVHTSPELTARSSPR
jgi:putative transposase